MSGKSVKSVNGGKRVSGLKREIDEVKNAHSAYSAIETFNPYSIDDLLKAHGLMTKGLVNRPGKWRNCNVGVVGPGGEVYHMAPQWSLVPGLMADLFRWLNETEAPMLIKSCVFHYEFEFIHPFPDGNGRTGRLWQTALLGSWRNEFYGAPVENIVWAHQREYYDAIRESAGKGDSGPFIDFMLDKILRTLKAKGEAYEVVVKTQRASTSHLQRQMGIGYKHAAGLINELEANGVIGPQRGMGPRKVLVGIDLPQMTSDISISIQEKDMKILRRMAKKKHVCVGDIVSEFVHERLNTAKETPVKKCSNMKAE